MNIETAELHWMLGIIQYVDVGLLVLDRDNRIKLWNGFMENHSGIPPSKAIGRSIFDVLPDIDKAWFQKKAEAVFLLDNRSFSTWRQHQSLTHFDSYHPITGPSEGMYQNITIFPLKSLNGIVDHICLMIYDVTSTAMDELALEKINAQLERQSKTDGLTGLYNRGTWQELFQAEFKREDRSGTYGTLAMLDIDHFKKINDTYGHQAGDEVLKVLSKLISDTKRQADIAGRYGGEEFAVMLVDTGIDGARIFAERLRERVERLVVPYDGKELKFTISVGLAVNCPAFANETLWLKTADQALYHSKHAGRNRITIMTTADIDPQKSSAAH